MRVGEFTMAGTERFIQESNRTCTIGVMCSIQIEGDLLAPGNSLRVLPREHVCGQSGGPVPFAGGLLSEVTEATSGPTLHGVLST